MLLWNILVQEAGETEVMDALYCTKPTWFNPQISYGSPSNVWSNFWIQSQGSKQKKEEKKFNA